VFVHAALNHRDEGHLFITNRTVLLTNRRWFEAHFPGGQLNIMSLGEAVEYLGLYIRYREQFYASPNLTVGMFGWYWHLFRALVPRYHVEADAVDDYLRGFSCMQVLSLHPQRVPQSAPADKKRSRVGWRYSAVIVCLHVLRHSYYPCA